MTINYLHRRLYIILPCIILFIGANTTTFSQNIVNTGNPDELLMLVRTKQFNEFIDRFNYKANFNGEVADSVFRSKIPRDKMIGSLFDQKDPRIIKTDKKYSEKFVSEKAEFINEIVRENLKINKYSDKIIAEARSRVILNGAQKTIYIYLSQETVGKEGIKWVIDGVKGSIFNFQKSDTTYIRFIPPSSNETDFMNLKRALEDKDYLHYYSSKEYQPDYLTLFYYMINNGSLKFDYVEDVVYNIIDIPGWCIKVKEFNREDMNAGWLISDIEKKSTNRTNYLNMLKN